MAITDALAPAKAFKAVTPDDVNDFEDDFGSDCRLARSLYIGEAGTAVVVGIDGTAVSFVGLPAGKTLNVYCIRVNETNTTAGSIVAFF